MRATLLDRRGGAGRALGLVPVALLGTAACIGEIVPTSTGASAPEMGGGEATMSPALPGVGAQGVELAKGETLYGTLCADCHGPLSSSTKKGKSFAAIEGAIASI